MPTYRYSVIEYFYGRENGAIAKSMELNVALLLVKALLEKHWEDDAVSYRIAKDEQDDRTTDCDSLLKPIEDEPIKEDSVSMTNEDGCQWCDGVGYSPKGHFCGECDCINQETCYVRELEKKGKGK